MSVRILMALLAAYLASNLVDRARAAGPDPLEVTVKAERILSKGGKANALAALSMLRQAGADAVVESSEITRLSANDRIYVLEVYARSALAAGEELARAEKAASIVIDANRHAAALYRLRLEIVGAMKPTDWTDRRRAQARQDYKHYVALAPISHQPGRRLSDGALALALANMPADVCKFVQEMARHNRLDEIDQYMNPETPAVFMPRARIGELIPAVGEEWISEGDGVGSSVYVSFVDFDNDGIPDIHLKNDGYRTECGFSRYYKGEVNSPPYGELLSENEEECDDVSFIRYRGVSYVRSAEVGLQVCMAKTSADMRRARVTRDCDETICVEVAQRAREIAKAPDKMRAGRKVYSCSDCPSSDGIWLIDANNDGFDDFVLRRQTGDERWPLEYCFFDDREDKDLNELFATPGCVNSQSDFLDAWGFSVPTNNPFTFLAYEGKTYALEMWNFTLDVFNEYYPSSEMIRISIIEKDHTRSIGDVRIEDPPVQFNLTRHK